MQPTIFVQIPAYRDPDLLVVLNDAFELATEPKRLAFGVCWRYIPGVDDPMLPARALPKNMRMLALPIEAAAGDPSASEEELLSGLYGGEDYVLSADCSACFSKDWDNQLIGLLENRDRTLESLTVSECGGIGFEFFRGRGLPKF